MKTNDFFNDYASEFSSIYGQQNGWWRNLLSTIFRKSMRDRFLKTIDLCDPQRERTILDIGSGPGHYALALAQKGFGSVYGIDFAPAMIEIANQMVSQSGQAENCQFVCGNFLDYEFDRVFDYTILMGFMDYVADPVVVIKKAISLTKHQSFFSFPVSSGFLAWFRRIRYKKRCDLYMYNAEEIKQLFEKAGHRNIRIEKMGRDYFVIATVKQ